VLLGGRNAEEARGAKLRPHGVREFILRIGLVGGGLGDFATGEFLDALAELGEVVLCGGDEAGGVFGRGGCSVKVKGPWCGFSPCPGEGSG
jgi:hypothetical protein